MPTKAEKLTHISGKGRKAAQTLTRGARVASKEQAIIQVAYEMFAIQGFAKTTISEIARRAGVAEGTVYLYFSNKESIARAVLRSFYESLTEKAQAGVDKIEPTRDRIEFLARHHLESILKERRLLELLTTLDRDMETYEGSELYKMNRAYVAVFDRVIRDGAWRGEIKDGYSPWLLRDLFFGSLEHAMRTILIKHRKDQLGSFVDELVGLMMNALAPQPEKKVTKKAGVAMTEIVERMEAATERLEHITKTNPLEEK